MLYKFKLIAVTKVIDVTADCTVLQKFIPWGWCFNWATALTHICVSVCVCELCSVKAGLCLISSDNAPEIRKRRMSSIYLY